MSLNFTDFHILRAVEAWTELGNYPEAHRELDSIALEKQAHPDVMEYRFQIYASAKEWDAAATIARKITERDPSRAAGWLHLAYATRRASSGSLQAAWDILSPASERFPENALIQYNLACYSCQMGQLDEAKLRLRNAFKTGNAKEIKRMASSDPDLQPLGKEIAAM